MHGENMKGLQRGYEGGNRTMEGGAETMEGGWETMEGWIISRKEEGHERRCGDHGVSFGDPAGKC